MSRSGKEWRNDKEGLDGSLDRKGEIRYNDMVMRACLGWMERGIYDATAVAAVLVV
jgi:uncharacterized protein YycO